MKPVSHTFDRIFWFPVMGPDILTGYVRNKVPVTIAFGIHNKASFFALLLITEMTSPEINTEFKRHIEPWKACISILLRPADVVNAIS